MVQMDSLLPILMARLTGRPNMDAVFAASADIRRFRQTSRPPLPAPRVCSSVRLNWSDRLLFPDRFVCLIEWWTGGRCGQRTTSKQTGGRQAGGPADKRSGRRWMGSQANSPSSACLSATFRRRGGRCLR